MSRSIPGALATHYGTRYTTIAEALRVTRPDGNVSGYTSHDESASIAGVTYAANPGLDVSQLANSAGGAVGNLELTVLRSATGITQNDVLAGVWRNSAFLLFRYNWASPPADLTGVDKLLAGTFGEAEPRQATVVIELRDLRQYLQQPVGSASSKTCRYRLGSTDKNNGGLCLKAITASPFTVSGTITASPAPTRQVFRDSARAEAADYFGEGLLTWTSGNNTGRSAKIKTYAADGTFTVAIPMFSTVQAGDAYTAVAGCRKRYAEDCIAKFDNGVNFGGEPHRRGRNNLTQEATIDV